MEHQRQLGRLALSLTTAAIVFTLLIASRAHGADLPSYPCPPSAKSCKIITLTPEEEQILVGPNAIFNTATQGRFIDLSPPVAYLREKIDIAPQGLPAEAPAKAGTVEPEKKSEPNK